jgi:hypothetical protein
VNTSKRFILLALIIGVVMTTAVSIRTRAAADPPMRTIMQTKLVNTQALLKGIVTADYKEIDRASNTLDRISEAEILSWQNPPKPEYVKQAMLFMGSVADLRKASERRDIRGAGEAYSDLVATCVHCHFYVRDTRAASLSIPGVRAYPNTTR